MTDADEIKLGVALNEQWPGKFTGDKMRVWCDHFDGTPVAKVLSAIVEWACYEKGRFPPTIDEIAAIIKSHEPAPEKPIQRSTVIATEVLRANPDMAHHTDAALHVAYHRGNYMRRWNEVQARLQIQNRPASEGGGIL